MTADPLARWGLVATVKAPPEALLEFAAWHLEQGAHRLFLYLDAPCPKARPLLEAHPKIRLIETDTAHWQKRRGRVPQKHQVRQSLNATRCYRRQAQDLDWLIHMDADEFLWSEAPLAETLAALPPEALCARVRPLERLAGSTEHYKAAVPPDAVQDQSLARIYPQFGPYLRGGFVSHVQGKLFIRTGLGPAELRIHNAYLDEVENPAQVELPQVDLLHHHTGDWTHWLGHYRYRLEQGSYRAELRPARSREDGGATLHELLSLLESEQGESGLRAFFDEVCADTATLRSRLAAEGLLRQRTLPLEELRRKHFPQPD